MIGSPEQNGIKERFFGALKDEEVWPNEYETRAEAITAIDAWIDFYRTERPHQALGYLTPRRVPRPQRRHTPLNNCNPRSLKCHLPTGPPTPPSLVLPVERTRSLARTNATASPKHGLGCARDEQRER
jgi:putative transposase